MWTGSTALKNIDQSLQTLRNEVVRLDAELDQLSSRATKNERHRLQLINQIAQLRLTEIERGSLLRDLDAADNDVQRILEDRTVALAGLDAKIASVSERVTTAEHERESLLEKANSAEQAIVDLEASVQSGLEQDETYLTQLQDAQKAESVAEEAALKVERTQASLAEKSTPYKADELFMYLWNRGFGTTKYEGGLFARFMDSWVARIIKYEAARVDYWNLTEIPKRLQAHAQAVADLADQQHKQLQQLELQALESAGQYELVEKADAVRSQLDAHDDTLETLEITLDEHLSERAKYVAGEDAYTQQCLSRLSQALEIQGLDSIHQYVRATVSPTDDQLVMELQSLHNATQGIRDDLSDVRSIHDKKLGKLRDLEGVRRKFKRSRFDDVRSGFGNQALLASVMTQFMQGLVSGSDLWRVIQRNQRYRQVASRPDFGSGGLGEIADVIGDELLRQGRRRSSRHRSSWNWPKARRGGGGFRFPSGRSSGGFKTGGGF